MSLRALTAVQTRRILDEGGLLIDLRPVDDYLDGHLPGSISLLFEDGPGLGGRARDLLPLDARLVLVEDASYPLERAAEMLRGKGFDVPGYLPWRVDSAVSGDLSETPSLTVDEAGGLRLLDVADPGTLPVEGVATIPVERLWTRPSELDPKARLGVLAGWGVRAATAVGILERLGIEEIRFVRTRPSGAKPPMAGPEVFRVGGTA